MSVIGPIVVLFVVFFVVWLLIAIEPFTVFSIICVSLCSLTDQLCGPDIYLRIKVAVSHEYKWFKPTP